MKSGIIFSELYYNPFGDLAKYFYGKNLKKYMSKSKMKNSSKKFDYVSVNTDLLGWILENATNQSVPDYLQVKVWQPLEMQYNATWSLDSKKHNTPKFSFGLNTRASDLLKLGYLYLNNGVYNSKSIVSPQWINRINKVELNELNQANYKNHWWRESEYKTKVEIYEHDMVLDMFESIDESAQNQKIYQLYTGNFYAAGFLGQFVYVNPSKNIVIVRTGEKQGKVDWIKLFSLISTNMNTAENKG